MRTRKKERYSEQQKKQAMSILLYLLQCSLEEQEPKIQIDGSIWKLVWNLARYNNLEATAWPAVEQIKDTLPDGMEKTWKMAAANVLYRQMQFEVEREEIFQKMQQKGIAYLPLKGIQIENLYPKPGMRYMCDNDILYGYIVKNTKGQYQIRGGNEKEKEENRKQAQEDLKKIMTEQGYEAISLEGNHDVYHKSPMFNFEMHRDLVSALSKYYNYYKNPWEKAKKSKNSQYEYYFGIEEQYLFMTIHSFKHFKAGGCGIRALTDEFVFLKKYEKEMDWNYIRRELEVIQLEQFEHKLKEAAKHSFSKGQKNTKDDWEIIGYMFGSGTYGTKKNMIKNEIMQIEEQGHISTREAKIAYLKNRIFMDEKTMAVFFPFFYKHPSVRWLLPFYRTIYGLLLHPKYLWMELKEYRKYK